MDVAVRDRVTYYFKVQYVRDQKYWAPVGLVPASEATNGGPTYGVQLEPYVFSESGDRLSVVAATRFGRLNVSYAGPTDGCPGIQYIRAVFYAPEEGFVGRWTLKTGGVLVLSGSLLNGSASDTQRSLPAGGDPAACDANDIGLTGGNS